MEGGGIGWVDDSWTDPYSSGNPVHVEAGAVSSHDTNPDEPPWWILKMTSMKDDLYIDPSDREIENLGVRKLAKLLIEEMGVVVVGE